MIKSIDNCIREDEKKKKKKVSCGDVDKKRGSDSVKGTTGTSGLRGGGLFG